MFIRSNVAALIALAVAGFLLFAAPSHAGLLSEVPQGHWSYQAVERLAEAGLVDPLPGKGSLLPVDRYELARRVGDVRSIVDAVRILEFDDARLSSTSVRGAKARVVAAGLQIELLRTLIEGVASGVQGDLDTGPQTPAIAVLRELREIFEAAEHRFDGLKADAALVWSLDEEGARKVADPEALKGISETFEAIAGDVASDVARALDGAPDQIRDLRARSIDAAVSEVFGLWVRWGALGRSESGVPPFGLASVPGERGALAAEPGGGDPFELVRDLEALETEYASELAVIGGRVDAFEGLFDEAKGAAYRSLRAFGESDEERASGGPVSGEPASGGPAGGEGGKVAARSGIAGVIDRLVSGVTAEAGLESRDRGLAFGWSATSGIRPRFDVVGVSDFAEARRIGAEYPMVLHGVEIKAGVGWQTVPSGAARESEATLEASVPMFGGRGGVGASYAVVDVDRLYELASRKQGEDGSGSQGIGESHVRSLTIGAALPLGEAASIKVGYEVRSGSANAAGAGGLVGAGLEYQLGTHGTVRAAHQWSALDDEHRSRTGVDFGYRIGENTSLLASYSMIQFESGGEAYRDNLGAAKVEVRF